MKQPANVFTATLLAAVLSAPPSIWASPQPDDRVREVELDPHQVISIPVSKARVTTVSFPGPIAAIDAAMVSTGNKPDGLFQMAHHGGSAFFSIRTLVAHAETNVNVRWNQKTYILELHDSDEPVLSVILRAPSDRTRSVSARGESLVSPAGLLGLLDKAKAFPFLKQGPPSATMGITHREFSDGEAVSDFTEFEVRVAEVFRFEAQDTLVFRVRLRNKTEALIQYRPDGFSIRAGAAVYGQSLSDASGEIPGGGEAEAFFAVTGTASGGRNDLAIKNEFTVLVERITPQAGVRRAAAPSKNVEGFAK